MGVADAGPGFRPPWLGVGDSGRGVVTVKVGVMVGAVVSVIGPVEVAVIVR